MAEDPEKNRMLDALELFKSICEIKSINGIPIIVFLNKIDIFTEKIEKYSIKDYFPDYNAKENSLKEAKRFFRQKFTNIIQQVETEQQGLKSSAKPQIREAYFHYTNNTDSKLTGIFLFYVAFVINAVSDIILTKNMQDINNSVRESVDSY